jgi:H+/gluconate symporter-like permease
MTALPGNAQIHNLIPMSYFGTTAFAAPILGIITGLLMFVLGSWWLQYRLRSAWAQGESYGYSKDFSVHDPGAYTASTGNAWIVALLPIVLVIVSNFVFSSFWIPTWKTDYLATPSFGSASLQNLIGTWSMIMALLLGILFLLIVLWSKGGLKSWNGPLNSGALGALLPTFNTASEVGYGATIAALSGFAWIRDGIFSIAPNNPLFAEMISVNVLSGITGSASGGLSIALGALGTQFLSMGQAAGISPEVLHRVAALSSGGLDSLPHNGAVITILTVCGLSHRESYKDIFVVSLLVPIFVTFLCVSVGLLLGVFR